MLVKFNFLSQSLQLQTNVTMCLPSFSFSDQLSAKRDGLTPGVKFQVMYLLHGGFGDDSDYVNFTNIVRYADDNKIAVVMPCGYNSFYTDGVEGFFVSKYWQYVSEELPALCQAMFPISPKREDNYVGGLSMGSHGAMKMAVMNGERFAGALIMSGTSLDDTDRTPILERNYFDPPSADCAQQNPNRLQTESYIYQQAAENIKSGKACPKLYFTCGGDDIPAVTNVKASRDYFARLGYETVYTEIPGYRHEWDFWDLALRKALYEWLPIERKVLRPDQ
jgi:putative tributyrin esterase